MEFTRQQKRDVFRKLNNASHLKRKLTLIDDKLIREGTFKQQRRRRNGAIVCIVILCIFVLSCFL